MTQYKNLNEIMNDVELLINDFIIETEKLVNNKIKDINEFINKNINLSTIKNVKDMAEILSNISDEIEMSKKMINNQIMEQILYLDINLRKIQNESAKNMKSIEKELAKRYTNWFARVFHNKNDHIEYRKSKVIVEQLKKITCTDISLQGQVEDKLNNSKTSNNILDITDTLEIFNNIQNIAEVATSNKNIKLNELLLIKNSLNKDTKQIFDNIKEDINNLGSSWKEILFKETDFHLKGSLDNSTQLNYLNKKRYVTAFSTLIDKSYQSIKETAINSYNGDINYKNAIAVSLISITLLGTYNGFKYNINNIKSNHFPELNLAIIKNIDEINKNKIAKLATQCYDNCNAEHILSQDSIETGIIDKIYSSTITNYKTIVSYMDNQIGDFDTVNNIYDNINLEKLVEDFQSLEKHNPVIELKNEKVAINKNIDELNNSIEIS